MKVGIIGLGYWGPNLVRNFLANNSVDEVHACDKDEKRRELISKKFPAAKLCADFNEMLKSDIDCVAIATPVDTHHKLAKAALEAGKHIWVEKPFTSTVDEAVELNKIADEKNLKIFVDHTFLYTGAVRKIKELVDDDVLGDIIYFDSVRVNLGLFQHDVNVVWDLAPHDLSIMNYLMKDKKIKGIACSGVANYYDYENVAYISVHFEKEDNAIGHFHVNWTSPVKIRKMLIGGTKKMLLWDDMENVEKLRIYDAGIEMKNKEEVHEALVQYRIGDMHSPKVNQTEALALGVEEFLAAIKEDRKPLTSGKEGELIVRILEASNESIKNDGKFVEL